MSDETRIRQALDLLHDDGWTKDPTGIGPVCAAQALARVWQEHQTAYMRDLLMVIDVAEELFPERLVGTGGRERILVMFNDHEDTTIEDIIEVFSTSARQREGFIGWTGAILPAAPQIVPSGRQPRRGFSLRKRLGTT